MRIVKSVIAGAAIALLGNTAAWAACTGPAGVEGEIIYNSTYKVPQFCDGTSWKNMWVAGFAGAAPPPSAPPPGNGYFVLTAGSWDGNLGGLVGADAKCLADLTANDWLGKTDALLAGQLDGVHVRAWIGKQGSANYPNPNTSYYFAVSGDPTKGGAWFTSNASGQGPGNNFAWSGVNYFGADYRYWAGHGYGGGSSTLFPTTGMGDWPGHCASWTWTGSGPGSNDGYRGRAAGTDGSRWSFDRSFCDQPNRIICMVHP